MRVLPPAEPRKWRDRVLPCLWAVLVGCNVALAQVFTVDDVPQPSMSFGSEASGMVIGERMNLDMARENLEQATWNQNNGYTIENGWCTTTPSVGAAQAEYESQVFQYNAALNAAEQELARRREEEDRLRREREEEDRRWTEPIRSSSFEPATINGGVSVPCVQRIERSDVAEKTYLYGVGTEEPRVVTKAEWEAIRAAERVRYQSGTQMRKPQAVTDERAPMPESRIWTDHKGQQFSAKWVEVNPECSRFVLVSDKTGKRINAVYRKFSEADKKFLRDQVSRYEVEGYVVHNGWWYKAQKKSRRSGSHADDSYNPDIDLEEVEGR